MKMLKYSLVSMLLLVSSQNIFATVCGPDQTTLIELYTSQGCSSCPPAEQWLNRYKTSGELWIDIVPVAFHVDYWDYLGWKDNFAHPNYSQRQRQHQSLGNIRSVYTPGIVVNGKEWKGFFYGKKSLPKQNAMPGILNVNISNNQLSINFTPETEDLPPDILHIAWLRMNHLAKIGRGENSGRTLEQEFNVIKHTQEKWKNASKQSIIRRQVPESLQPEAVAVWLADTEQRPVQACGTFIN